MVEMKMKAKKRYRQCLIGILMINLIAIGFFSYDKLCKNIPDDLRITVNQKEDVRLPLGISGVLGELQLDRKVEMPESIGVLTVNNKKLEKNSIKIDLHESFSIQSETTGKYKMKVSLFGVLPIKTVNVHVVEEEYLIPGGFPIGITIKTDGLLALGTGIVNGADGLNYEPALNIIKTGDYILAIDNQKVETKEELIKKIQESNGEKIQLTVNRNEEIIDISIKPCKTSDGSYKAGIWIREDTQGIGTLTYIDLEGKFGALGHGITDTDTGILMKVLEGGIYKANILEVVKGKAGTPGELVGTITKRTDTQYGEVIKNTGQGVFGQWTIDNLPNGVTKEAIPIGYKQDVKKGPAWIRCQVDGEIKEYKIEIESIELNSEHDSKGMVIHITDEELLNNTNGIIQGMSGSPIFQNDKIIGAVTHVFVQDSTRGYGIFIENMLKYEK